MELFNIIGTGCAIQVFMKYFKYFPHLCSFFRFMPTNYNKRSDGYGNKVS
jgi:hypothetical protein